MIFDFDFDFDFEFSFDLTFCFQALESLAGSQSSLLLLHMLLRWSELPSFTPTKSSESSRFGTLCLIFVQLILFFSGKGRDPDCVDERLDWFPRWFGALHQKVPHHRLGLEPQRRRCQCSRFLCFFHSCSKTCCRYVLLFCGLFSC